MKKLIYILLLVLFLSTPVYAKEVAKSEAVMNSGFSLLDVPKNVTFTIKKEINPTEDIVIPEGSVINADIYQYQRERRWHKSGFFICKLISYKLADSDKTVDVSSSDIYFVARKYEEVNKMDAAITGTELIVTTSASFFLPGIDILYFFTKGAIQCNNHPNWFKSGVREAYDNSICWIWFKGKPIELSEGEMVTLKEIDEDKAQKLYYKIEKRHIKENKKINKKKNKKKNKKSKNKNLSAGECDNL